MLLAQSLLDASTKTVPIAALTTVLLGAVLAPWIARRQEAGKAEAATVAALRARIIELRADVVYARGGLDRNSTYVPDRFTGHRLAEFTVHVVEGTRQLSTRRQQKVADALVALVGEWRVNLAEEVGPAWLRGDETLRKIQQSPSWNSDQSQARKQLDEEREQVLFSYNKRALESGNEDDGLLGRMAKSQLPHEDHPLAVAGLDKLLAALGGNHRLGNRA
ncbi:hypothetical protein [Streptomyces sp. NPDC056308]|uniref:hypothetical protein n=1 Tax=Streptomyces sp. NPDC056308 TaxID=3345780 RepID=UPI0035DEA81B